MATTDVSTSGTPARQELFNQLKPCCVPLSQLAIWPLEGPDGIRKLAGLVDELYAIINRQINRDPSALDEKLADYVFFPLSHVFRNQAQYPARVIEVALRSLTALIIHGWKARISPQIVQQLLILLTFIVGGVPGQDTKHDLPEETSLEALRALTALVTATGSSATAVASLVETKNVPALGHTVTVLLDSVTDGKTPEIQAEALRTLQAFFISVKDHAALASFLPGVVSSLARLLSTPAREKTRILVSGINTLKIVLVAVLSDLRTRSITRSIKAKETTAQVQTAETTEAEEDKGKILSPGWLRATVSQIKLALATVLKLRSSKSQDIRDALGTLCLSLLDECHSTLDNCTSILVESAIILDPEDDQPSLQATSLQDLATIYPELGETAKGTVYNWITSLPRIMQSAEESNKQIAIRNLLRGTELITRLQLDSSTLSDAVSMALRDSVSSLVVDASKQPVASIALDHEFLSSSSRDLIKGGGTPPSYQLVVMSQESQTKTRSEMLNLIAKVGSASQQVNLALEMLDYTRELNGPSQIASYWLSFELVKAAFARTRDVDAFLDLGSFGTTAEEPEVALHEVYNYSVSILDMHDEAADVDWRLEAIALEVAAFAAGRSGEAFRPELIDVLYPVTAFMGSSNPRLREHAITTLNFMASSCGYNSVSELVIENVDYLVSSVSLRLNTLDITPASTKVLIMMTRLTGPRLIPYLDDVVASIFAALDNYHGYPIFVESLFSVLKEVVEQGVKSDRLLLEGRQNGPSSHKKQRPKQQSMDDFMQLLDRREQRRQEVEKQDAEIDEALRTGHPKTPWGPGKDKTHKSFIEELAEQEERKEKEAEGGNDEEEAEEEDPSGGVVEKEKPPKTPTYHLLEKAAFLTQHYLTSPAPTLRKSLLDLLATVAPALSADEDAFLPLINAVWPVVVGRLYDGEPFVVVAACDVLSILCQTAGDFLTSRIKTEWWDALGKWCREKKKTADTQARGKGRPATTTAALLPSHTDTAPDILVPSRAGGSTSLKSAGGAPPGTELTTGSGGGGGLGRFASAAQIWEAVVRLLVAVVSYVRIEDELFDEVLALLADRLLRDPEAREALEVINADAVWYALYELGQVEILTTPVLDGVEFPPMQRLGAQGEDREGLGLSSLGIRS